STLAVALIAGEMLLLLHAALSKVLPKRQVRLPTHHVAASIHHQPHAQTVAQEIAGHPALDLRQHPTAAVDVLGQQRPRAAIVLSDDLTALPDVMRHTAADGLLQPPILLIVG